MKLFQGLLRVYKADLEDREAKMAEMEAAASGRSVEEVLRDSRVSRTRPQLRSSLLTGRGYGVQVRPFQSYSFLHRGIQAKRDPRFQRRFQWVFARFRVLPESSRE